MTNPLATHTLLQRTCAETQVGGGTVHVTQPPSLWLSLSTERRGCKLGFHRIRGEMPMLRTRESLVSTESLASPLSAMQKDINHIVFLS